MKLTDEGLQRIAAWESCVLHLYNDPVGLCTIGYGHLVHRGKVGTNPVAEAPFKNGLTKDEAVALLRTDASVYEEAVNEAIRVPLAPHQFDALVCLCFNIGSGGFLRSSLVRYLNETKPWHKDEIRKLFCLWCRAGGQKNPGLLRRRNAEADAFTEDMP